MSTVFVFASIWLLGKPPRAPRYEPLVILLPNSWENSFEWEKYFWNERNLLIQCRWSCASSDQQEVPVNLISFFLHNSKFYEWTMAPIETLWIFFFSCFSPLCAHSQANKSSPEDCQSEIWFSNIYYMKANLLSTDKNPKNRSEQGDLHTAHTRHKRRSWTHCQM